MATSDQDGDTMSYAEVNGISLYYEEHGSGQPLVLLHARAVRPVMAGSCSPPGGRVVRRLGPQRRRAVTRRAAVPGRPAVFRALFRAERPGSFLPASRHAVVG